MFNDIDSIIKPLTKMVDKLEKAVHVTTGEIEHLKTNKAKIEADIVMNEANVKRALTLKKRIAAIVEE